MQHLCFRNFVIIVFLCELCQLLTASAQDQPPNSVTFQVQVQRAPGDAPKRFEGQFSGSFRYIFGHRCTDVTVNTTVFGQQELVYKAKVVLAAPCAHEIMMDFFKALEEDAYEQFESHPAIDNLDYVVCLNGCEKEWKPVVEISLEFEDNFNFDSGKFYDDLLGDLDLILYASNDVIDVHQRINITDIGNHIPLETTVTFLPPDEVASDNSAIYLFETFYNSIVSGDFDLNDCKLFQHVAKIMCFRGCHEEFLLSTGMGNTPLDDVEWDLVAVILVAIIAAVIVISLLVFGYKLYTKFKNDDKHDKGEQIPLVSEEGAKHAGYTTLGRGFSEIDGIAEQSFQCDRCYQTFSTRTERHHHQRSQHELLNTCSLCFKSFSEADDYVDHVIEEHADKGETAFRGVKVGETPPSAPTEWKPYHPPPMLERKETAKRLLDVGEPNMSAEKFACAYCGREFSKKYNKNVHETIRHKKDYKFKCKIPGCSEVFPLKQSLVSHTLRHQNKKPFKCDLCGVGFIEKKNLKRHSKSKHIHPCSRCTKLFISKAALRRHREAHGLRVSHRHGIKKSLCPRSSKEESRLVMLPKNSPQPSRSLHKSECVSEKRENEMKVREEILFPPSEQRKFIPDSRGVFPVRHDQTHSFQLMDAPIDPPLTVDVGGSHVELTDPQTFIPGNFAGLESGEPPHDLQTTSRPRVLSQDDAPLPSPPNQNVRLQSPYADPNQLPFPQGTKTPQVDNFDIDFDKLVIDVPEELAISDPTPNLTLPPLSTLQIPDFITIWNGVERKDGGSVGPFGVRNDEGIPQQFGIQYQVNQGKCPLCCMICSSREELATHINVRHFQEEGQDDSLGSWHLASSPYVYPSEDDSGALSGGSSRQESASSLRQYPGGPTESFTYPMIPSFDFPKLFSEQSKQPGDALFHFPAAQTSDWVSFQLK